MAEKDPNPSEQPAKPDANAIDENEIDRVLAEAKGLTDHLEHEIGDGAPPPGSLADLESVSDSAKPADVEDQLDEIDAILKEVAGEPVTPESEASLAGESVHEKGEAVAEADAGQSDPQPAPDADEIQTQAPSGDQETHDSEEADEELPPIEIIEVDDVEALDRRTLGRKVKRRFAQWSGKAQDRCARVFGKLPRPSKVYNASRSAARHVLSIVLNRILAVLDTIDGAMTFVNYATRNAMGYVALALVAASCAIFAYSWLA